MNTGSIPRITGHRSKTALMHEELGSIHMYLDLFAIVLSLRRIPLGLLAAHVPAPPLTPP